MQDNTGKKLKSLFDFQRFEGEPKLQNVIDDTISTSSSIRRLSDDELDYAAAGTDNINGKAATTGRAYCPKCGKVMEVEILSGGRGKCMKCQTLIYGL